MGKKQYIAPKIIDLSLETITGVGAGNCLDGRDFTHSTCNPQGAGVTGVCDTGHAASADCIAGELPHQTGVYCLTDGGGAGTYCNKGESASSADGKCKSGSAAIGICDTTGGSPTPSNFCLSGPYNANCDSGYYQIGSS